MSAQEEYVLIPLDVSIVSVSSGIDDCIVSAILPFLLFYMILSMICLQCRTFVPQSPTIVEARHVAEEKV